MTKKASNTAVKKPALPVEEKSAGVDINNVYKLDAERPQPFEGAAFASFLGTEQYIPFLGDRDDYARVLLEARMLSATHNTCVQKKRTYCAGDGFQDANGVDLDPNILTWLGSLNIRNQSAQALNKDIFEGFFTHGNYPVELIRYTLGGKRYFHVYGHNFLEWRLGPEDETGIVQYAVQSKRFNSLTTTIFSDLKSARTLPLYSPYKSERANWKREANGTERTLIWYKNSATGVPNYGLPSAVSSLISQMNEYKGQRYDLDNFENNMVVSALLVLNGNRPNSSAKQIAREINHQHTGDGKRGKLSVISSEQGLAGSDFHTFDTHKEGSFNEADVKYSRKIMQANDMNPTILQMETTGSLGRGAGLFTEALRAFKRDVILPNQQDILDKVWLDVFDQCEKWTGLPFSKYKIQFKNNIDVSGITDIDITAAVQKNEVRTANGLPEDPKLDGVYMDVKNVSGNPNQQVKTGGANV